MFASMENFAAQLRYWKRAVCSVDRERALDATPDTVRRIGLHAATDVARESERHIAVSSLVRGIGIASADNARSALRPSGTPSVSPAASSSPADLATCRRRRRAARSRRRFRRAASSRIHVVRPAIRLDHASKYVTDGMRQRLCRIIETAIFEPAVSALFRQCPGDVSQAGLAVAVVGILAGRFKQPPANVRFVSFFLRAPRTVLETCASSRRHPVNRGASRRHDASSACRCRRTRRRPPPGPGGFDPC